MPKLEVDGHRYNEIKRPDVELKPSELGVLQGYADGLLPLGIAARLKISPGSIASVRSRIIDKASLVFKLFDVEKAEGFLPVIISNTIRNGQISNSHGIEVTGILTTDELDFANLNSQGKTPDEIAKEKGFDKLEETKLQVKLLEKYGVVNLNALAAKHTAIQMAKESESIPSSLTAK